MRAVILTFLLASTIWSCGSRQVNKSKTKSDLVVANTLELQTELKEIKLENSFYKSFFKNMNVRADSIIKDSQGNLKVYAPVIETEELAEEVKKDSFLDSNIDVVESDNLHVDEKKEDSSKDIDKKQFSWWQVIVPIVCSLFIVLGIKSLIKKRRYKALKK